jgi:hypothetical protein
VDLRHRQLNRVVLAQIAARPHVLDNVEAKKLPQRLLDDLRITPVAPRSTDSRSTEDVFVKIERDLPFLARSHAQY